VFVWILRTLSATLEPEGYRIHGSYLDSTTVRTQTVPYKLYMHNYYYTKSLQVEIGKLVPGIYADIG